MASPAPSPTPPRESWNSRLGVILAVSGSAVGLGNFLRFPSQVAEYGGGAYMVAYFLSFLFIGLPICWAEFTLGRMGGRLGFNSSPAILAAVSGRPWLRYLGVAGFVVPVTIYCYYVIVESWCAAYAVNYLLGNIRFETPEQASFFFNGLRGVAENGSALQFDVRHVGFFVIVVFILNFILIYRGLSKGIEWFCKFAMPTLVVIGIVVLIRVLTLGTPDPAHPERSVTNGLGFMWNPAKLILQEKGPADQWVEVREVFPGADLAATEAELQASPGRFQLVRRGMLEQLTNPGLWLAAASQIFFSLSVGFGVIITYSSYMKKDDDIVLSGLSAASANEFCEVGIGGLLSIPAGVAFFGVTGLAAIGLGTFDLGFNVLPLVFSRMPFGEFFGFLFFFLLFLAAITSSLSMLQPGIAYLEEALHLNRRQSVTILGAMTALGSGFVLYFSKDLKALDTIDYWVVNLLMVGLALLQIVIFSWVLGPERCLAEANRGAALRIPRFFGWIMRYITPGALLLMLGSWLLQVSGLGGGAQTVNPYIKDLFVEPNLVAWMSIGFVMVIAAFVLLTLPSAARLRAASQAATSPQTLSPPDSPL